MNVLKPSFLLLLSIVATHQITAMEEQVKIPGGPAIQVRIDKKLAEKLEMKSASDLKTATDKQQDISRTLACLIHQANVPAVQRLIEAKVDVNTPCTDTLFSGKKPIEIGAQQLYLKLCSLYSPFNRNLETSTSILKDSLTVFTSLVAAQAKFTDNAHVYLEKIENHFKSKGMTFRGLIGKPSAQTTKNLLQEVRTMATTYTASKEKQEQKN